jgi:predicted outer membrane repeat protein
LESSPTIINCTFSGNSAERDGGAIRITGSNSVITNCIFSGNLAGKRYQYASGGAIDSYSSNLMITNCIFIGNSASSSGGAMSNEHSSNPVVINCTFVNNFGSAMVNRFGCNPVVTNCTFIGNVTDGYGGAMSNPYGSPTVSNCTFTSNSAEKGGAMYNYRTSPTIINCTFTDNSADRYGGVMYTNDHGNPVLTNCILWGNGPQEIYNENNSNAIITYCDVQGGWEGVGNIDIDPLFVDPCNGDYHLYEDSPCIDAGDPNYVAGPNETDLDGNPRVAGGIIDMGAYELQPLTPAELLQDLTDYLDELSLQSGTANSLRSKLEAALQLLEDSNENNDGAAVNLLEAFINAVRAQSGRKIPAAEADILIEIAQEIIGLLGG